VDISSITHHRLEWRQRMMACGMATRADGRFFHGYNSVVAVPISKIVATSTDRGKKWKQPGAIRNGNH
jgi:hypothetical protein